MTTDNNQGKKPYTLRQRVDSAEESSLFLTAELRDVRKQNDALKAENERLKAGNEKLLLALRGSFDCIDAARAKEGS